MHALTPIKGTHQERTAADNVGKQYKTLKANLASRFFEKSIKTILFVGASKGNGTTTTATNFARILAKDAKYGVLLIDANYSRPSLSKLFKINPLNSSLGLAHKGVKLNLCKIEPSNLYVLPYNEQLPGPESIFQSPWFGLMYEKFDYIILDGPTTHDSPDIQELCSKVDGIILVIEAGKTRQQVVVRAKKQLEAAGGRILGAVLNKKKRHIPEFIYKYLY